MNDRTKYQKLSQRLQSDEEFKKRFLKKPKLVLAEIGINVPDNMNLEVHEDTATYKNFVLPNSLAKK